MSTRSTTSWSAKRSSPKRSPPSASPLTTAASSARFRLLVEELWLGWGCCGACGALPREDLRWPAEEAGPVEGPAWLPLDAEGNARSPGRGALLDLVCDDMASESSESTPTAGVAAGPAVVAGSPLLSGRAPGSPARLWAPVVFCVLRFWCGLRIGTGGGLEKPRETSSFRKKRSSLLASKGAAEPGEKL